MLMAVEVAKRRGELTTDEVVQPGSNDKTGDQIGGILRVRAGFVAFL
jgi:hypothetical protein